MINILYCGNQFDGFLTSMLSIFKRTTTKEPFNINIFTMDVSHINPKFVATTDEEIEFLDKIAKEYNKENRVTKFDVTEIYKKEFGGCPNEKAYCSPYTLIRLFADKYFDGVEKLLYLDSDIMFNKDIMLLYGQDVENFEYASARDCYGKWLINPNYINAGVLLFNMKMCKQTKLFEKAQKLIKTKKMLFADQDAIYRSTTKKKMLPQKFNSQFYLRKNTVVRHFSKRLFWLPYPHTENIKQWNVEKVHSKFKYTQFDDILSEYMELKKSFENQKKGRKENEQK